ncbi:MAG: HAMP domain-containing sensor histidine kinase [Hyphomicrobiaceae bacterium]
MAEDPDPPASIAHIWAQAAHDLRQPVQAALLLAGGLDSTAEPAQLQRTASHIDGSLRCLDDMLEILILLSRIEAGLQMATPRPCELADLLQPILQETTAIAAERGQPLSFEGLDGMVRSHPRLLAAAVRSLVINAIDSADGEAISVGCRRHGDTLRLEAGFASARTGAQGTKRAFVQLAPSRKGSTDGLLGLGPILLEHVCRLLGHAFEDERPSPGRRRLALVLSASATSR